MQYEIETNYRSSIKHFNRFSNTRCRATGEGRYPTRTFFPTFVIIPYVYYGTCFRSCRSVAISPPRQRQHNRQRFSVAILGSLILSRCRSVDSLPRARQRHGKNQSPFMHMNRAFVVPRRYLRISLPPMYLWGSHHGNVILLKRVTFIKYCSSIQNAL